MFHALLFVLGAGSFVLPVAYVAVTLPISDAVPTPRAGEFVPIVTEPLGGELLKVHWVITSAQAF